MQIFDAQSKNALAGALEAGLGHITQQQAPRTYTFNKGLDSLHKHYTLATAK